MEVGRKEGKMDVLDKVRQWVQTFPLWEEGNLLYIDFTDGVPGNVGIFPEKSANRAKKIYSGFPL